MNSWQEDPPGYAGALDADALADAEGITEMLRREDEHANGSPYEVFAEMDDEPVGSFQTSRRTGLVHLLGSNPNAGETREIASFKKS